MLFHSDDHFTLANLLDQIVVPMFAAERKSKNAPFRLISVNGAHTAKTALTTDLVRGKRLCDLLRAADAAAVNARYAACADGYAVSCYDESLVLNGVRSTWKTTLQPVILPDGTERVIGTAIALDKPVSSYAADDAAYYSSHAQMQVGKLRYFLDMLEDRRDVPADMRGMAAMVNNLTYSIDAALGDIRNLSHQHPSLSAQDNCAEQAASA